MSGGEFVSEFGRVRVERSKQIEAAMRDAGITEENAGEYRMVSRYDPGAGSVPIGIQDRAGEWVVTFDTVGGTA